VNSLRLFFSLPTYFLIAQYFQAADHIVVLGDNGIIDQGNWQDIETKAASIKKFSSSHYIKDNAILSTNFDQLGAQFRAKDEAEMDLSRQTGDSALYGNSYLPD
jgi:ATP-binding cassette subfamily C (CFTR/MRP) protein 1